MSSLSRPDANLTEAVILSTQLEAKRVEVLNVLLPGVAPLGVLVNAANSAVC